MTPDRRKYYIVNQLNKLADLSNNIQIKFATTSDEFIQAMHIIEQVYIRRGYVKQSKRKSFFSPYIILPNNRLISDHSVKR